LPTLSKDHFLSQLHHPYKKFTLVPHDAFMQMFYQFKLQQFDLENELLLQQKENRMETIQKELPKVEKCRDQATRKKQSAQQKIDQYKRKKKRWLRNLFKMKDIMKQETQNTELLLEQTKLYEDNSLLHQSLEKEHRQLYTEVNEMKADRRSLEEAYRSERLAKERTYQDEFFEIPLDTDHSILFQFHLDFSRFVIQPFVVLVKKTNGYFIPTSRVHQRSFRTNRNIQELIDKAWSYIQDTTTELKTSFDE
jgi:hypothetical protein